MSTRARPRLMIVEDDPDTAAMMLETLGDHFAPGCAEHFTSLAQALAQDASEIDLVLTDMNLPDGTGLDLLERLLERRADLPVVLVTAVNVLDTAAHAIARGAYDYVVKAGDYLLSIPVIVEKNLAQWRVRQDNLHLQAELKRTLAEVRVKNEQLVDAVAKLERMAATDPLTGLANRRAFNAALERCFAEAQRHGHDVSCLMIDLDAFKQVNDTLGHAVGDRLLQQAARVLDANCRRSDVAGRFGGDELVLLLPQAGEAIAGRVGHRVREQFVDAAQAALATHDRPLPVTMSIGLSSLHGSQAHSAAQLVTFADHAMYQAKLAGKQRLVAYRRLAEAGHPPQTARH